MKKILASIFLSAILISTINAQNTGTTPANTGTIQTYNARVSPEWVISLPENAPLQTHYTLDMTNMHFESPAAMNQYFSSYKDDAVSFKVDQKANTVTMYLDPTYVKQNNWTVPMANTYLSNEATGLKSSYGTMYPEK